MKKFHLHLDALIVLVLIIVASLAMNYYQYKLYGDLARENIELTKENVVGKLNLHSCRDALNEKVKKDTG